MLFTPLKNHYIDASRAALDLAAGLGLEPRYHAPEACVLPLDDPAKVFTS